VIKRCHTISLALQTNLPTAIFYSSEFLFTIRCHQILQHHHHRNEAFMCQSDPVFLCPFQSMGNTKKHATNQTRTCRKCFNAYKSIENRPYRVLCPIFPASFYYEKKQRFAVMIWVQLTELEQNIFFAPTP